MQFSLTAEILSIDSDRYMSALRAFMLSQMKEAAKRFASTALRRIPIRTGFVAGAFQPLQQLLGETARLNPIVGFISKVIRSVTGSSSKRNIPRFREYYTGSGSRILKSPETGAQFGTPAGQIFRIEGNTVIFNFDVDITYFRISDIGPSRSPTAPWKAFVSGIAQVS